MNKILFGIIGLLFIGVIGAGAFAFKGMPGMSVGDADDTSVVSGAPDTAAAVTADGPAKPAGTPATTPVPGTKPSSQPTPAPTPASKPTQQPGTYTLAQVATHNSATSCYTAINGSVYDVTPFIRQHPGGMGAILSLCGRDGTSAFEGQHGGQGRPAAELATFKIGTLTS